MVTENDTTGGFLESGTYTLSFRTRSGQEESFGPGDNVTLNERDGVLLGADKTTKTMVKVGRLGVGAAELNFSQQRERGRVMGVGICAITPLGPSAELGLEGTIGVTDGAAVWQEDVCLWPTAAE